MQIDKTEIKIKELIAGYTRDEESSQIVAYEVDELRKLEFEKM